MSLPRTRLVHMESEADIWSITMDGYLVGSPGPREFILRVKEWLDDGALREINSVLFREGEAQNGKR